MTSTRRDSRPWLLLIAAVVVLLDRLSKLWIDKHVPRGEFITVIPHVFRISHVFNTGAAFSLFANSISPAMVRDVLIGFSFVAIIVVLVMIWNVCKELSLNRRGAGADSGRRDRESLRPHCVPVCGGFSRGDDRSLPLAGLQRGGLVHCDRRGFAAAGDIRSPVRE